MELVIDPAEVAAFAVEREDENWGFRAFLKNADMEVEVLDAIVHRHCEEVKRLSAGLGTTEQVCFDQLMETDEDGDTVFAAQPCPLLEENRCTVYEHRPDDCRSYPHLDKDEFVFHLAQAVENCAVCPIVYNVFERLKDELWGELDESPQEL